MTVPGAPTASNPSVYGTCTVSGARLFMPYYNQCIVSGVQTLSYNQAAALAYSATCAQCNSSSANLVAQACNVCRASNLETAIYCLHLGSPYNSYCIVMCPVTLRSGLWRCSECLSQCPNGHYMHIEMFAGICSILPELSYDGSGGE